MKNARRIKDINGMTQIMIDIKPNRCDSDVFIKQKIDVTELVKYIENKKKNKEDITYFHAFVTAIIKTMYNRPKLNRFVLNRHIYEHNNIVISFVAKVSFDDKSEEVMIMIDTDESDNIYSLSKKVKNKVDSYRNRNAKIEGANSAINIIGKFPNIFRVPLVGIFKFLDRKGMLPSCFIKDNLYYSSMIVSNLGSIKCGAIYHNITDFGTCSSLTTIGEIKDEEVIINGKKEIRKMCEFGINFDERVADGYYFAKSVKLLEYILNNPKTLENEVNKKIDVNELR